MQDLLIGAKSPGIRQVLCVMTLLCYNLIVCYVLSHQECDLKFCDELLQNQLSVSWLEWWICHLLNHLSINRSIQMAFGSYFSKDV